MARKIVVTSGKGGVGKTSVVANLGIKLANLGRRVALVDMDFGLNNLDMVMGVEHKIVYDVVDVIENKCRPKQALVQADNPNLFVLCYSHRNQGLKTLTVENVKSVIDGLDGIFDYVFIDCPAGIDAGFTRAVECSDEAIIVTTSHISSLRDADKVIGTLKSYDIKSVSLVVNMVRGDLVADGVLLSPETIEDLFKIPLIGIIPDSDAVLLSVGGNNLVGKAGKAFKILAQNVEKGTDKVYSYMREYKGVLGSIKRKLRRSL